MMSPRFALAVLLAPAAALAQSPHDQARLFPHEAELSAGDATSLVRLPLPAGVLSRARPDLSDVRIHDADGGEVPYLVDSGARSFPEDRPTELLLAPVGVVREGVQRPAFPLRYQERLAFAPPIDPPLGARWELRVGAPRPRFVATVVIARVRGLEREELARTTIFRLQDPLRERLGVELPALGDATADERLEVLLESEEGYLSPEVRLVAQRSSVEAPVLLVELAEIGRQQAGGRSVIELVRPAGLTPDRIRLSTSSANFHRPARVLDVRQGRSAVPIGDGAVFRVTEIAGAEELEIDVSAARGEILRIEISDGDSPALEALRVAAVVRQPVLVFEGSRARVLRFGGARAHVPRYDLMRLFGTSTLEHLLARALPEARLGEIRPNPRFDDGPALAFAMRPGREVDASIFTHRAQVTIAGARDGLSRLILPAAVLAVASEDARDVRIVDAQGRQWPYVRSPDAVHATLAPRVEGPSVEGDSSRFVLRLPVERAVVDGLSLRPDVPYLRRSFRLEGVRGEERTLLASGELTREPHDVRPIEIAFGATRVERLELVVVDGNDAPIALSEVEASVPSHALFVAAPDGEYRLMVGDEHAEPPQYEIAQAMALVLAVSAADARIEALEANPAHVEPAWYASMDAASWAVWAVLIVAVLALLLLTLRAARHGEGEGAPAPAAEPEVAAPPAQPEPEKEAPSEPREAEPAKQEAPADAPAGPERSDPEDPAEGA